MSGARQVGFTIVEITLFVAISGLLLLVAMTGTTTTIRTIRFSDSGRSLANYMQKHYDSLINGVNSRPADISCSGGTVTNSNQSVGTSNCLVLGKLIVIDQGTARLEAYNIVGSEPAGIDYSAKDETLIPQFQPRVVTLRGPEVYDIPWGAYVSGQKRSTDNKAVDAIALMRSPRSTRVMQYTFKTSEIPIESLQNVVNLPSTNMNKPVAICITSSDTLGAPAKLTVGDAPNQSAISIEFDRSNGECNGV